MNQIADAAWQCADPGVQYHSTINRWHTDPEHRADHRVQPLLRVHEHRRLGLQSRLAQPDEVPQRRRDLRRRRLRPRGRHRLPRPGDPRRVLQLPDRADHREREGVPPARPRLRQPRRPADGGRHALRLRRGTGDGRRDHRADDRPRLPQVGRGRRRDRPLRRLRGEPRAAQRGDADAPGRGLRDRGRAGRGERCCTPPGRAGTRRWRSASSTATATPRRPCSLRPGRSAS